ncbi:hypothetical protein O3P69_012934 [Scylla paramamosain]|uniref:Uncharacterized protein n=1 Tax=Scylla paramamosain TaxID=85552 RepID=A0AAW0TSA7_SCYPA
MGLAGVPCWLDVGLMGSSQSPPGLPGSDPSMLLIAAGMGESGVRLVGWLTVRGEGVRSVMQHTTSHHTTPLFAREEQLPHSS